MAGAPSIEHELTLSHERYFFFAFALPLVVAALLEAGVVAISDRLDRRRVLATSQVALAASLFAVALVHDPWTTALALAAAGAASGIACGIAQAAMIAESDRGADRAMLGWSLFSSFGDMLTPVLTWGALAGGHSYRLAMGLVGGGVLAQSIGALGHQRPIRAHADAEADSPSAPLLLAFSRAIRAPRLWLWLFASASCTLLDEIVIAIVALRLVREGRATEPVAALAAVFFATGAAAGAFLADKIVERWSARRVLSFTAMASLAMLIALASSRGFATTAISLFALGVLVAPHHPLALARAYETLPDNPGVVQACVQVFVAIDVGAPIVIGIVADRFGLGAALAFLALQPLVILVASLDGESDR